MIVGDDIQELLPYPSIDRVQRGHNVIWAAKLQSHADQSDEWLFERWGYPEGYGVFPAPTEFSRAPVEFKPDMADTFGMGRGPLFCCGGRLPLPGAVRAPLPAPCLSPRLARAMRQCGIEWRPGMPASSSGVPVARAGTFGDLEPSLRRQVALEI